MYTSLLASTIGLSIGLFLFAVALYRTRELPNPADRRIPRKYSTAAAVLLALFAAAYFTMR
ncbi:MAG: hypothetical protein HY341_01735 [Candidatus Kerfeldbacteria bacterium]|nr:hypothetical protein [Candidatus Kerfeldbacteria bacterium]